MTLTMRQYLKQHTRGVKYNIESKWIRRHILAPKKLYYRVNVTVAGRTYATPWNISKSEAEYDGGTIKWYILETGRFSGWKVKFIG